MRQYLDLLTRVMDEGIDKSDRTGVGTRSVFGHQMRFHLADGFPLVTTKKIYTRGVFGELLWFLRGDTNIGWLHRNNVHIWDEWADENGDLGPVYGHQWRSWPVPGGGHVDQLAKVIDQIKNDPNSRRLVVSAWNVAEVGDMALPPCHLLFQFYVTPARTGSPASCPAGSTSAAPTCSWACRSTSRATPCSPTWWRRCAAWASATSSTPWVMRTSTTTTSTRWPNSCPARPRRCRGWRSTRR